MDWIKTIAIACLSLLGTVTARALDKLPDSTVDTAPEVDAINRNFDVLAISKFDNKTSKDSIFHVKVGTFTSASGTGDQTISGVGFKPRFLLLGMGVGASDSIIAGLGWTTATSQVSIFGFRSDDTNSGGVSTDATTVIRWTDVAGAVQGQAAFVAFTADGFTLNWSAADARVIGYAAIE